MFSKFVSRVNQAQSLSSMTTRAFRASAVANKGNQKPSIGDAVTILQSKVSGINQVVSRTRQLMATTTSKHALFFETPCMRHLSLF